MPDDGLTDERRKELERAVGEIFGGFRQHIREVQSTPVDVHSELEDGALDDHLWLRVEERFRDEPGAMPDRVRAYYATRAFETYWLDDGVDGFLDYGANIGPFVSEGYRLLNVPQAAVAFEALWSSAVAHRLLGDPVYEPTDAELSELEGLAEAVGEHKEERIAFVRQYPDDFSI
jgi:hypothetical protein